jgi:hypothetical protein
MHAYKAVTCVCIHAYKTVTGKLTHLVNDHGEVGPSKKAKCATLRVQVRSSRGNTFYL